jgi:branched-chain amino acid transport system ATP-binding protein
VEGAALRAEGATVQFGRLSALTEVDLALGEGEILGLIGPNGAGKTTMVNVLSGFQRPTGGRVLIGERDVTGLKPERLAHLGLTRTFQSTRLFGLLTVRENVETGIVGRRTRQRSVRATAQALLERMGLAHQADARASTLSHGHQRLIGVVRALATEPRFLLLDEPAAGLDEGESAELAGVIRRVRDEFGCGVMVIEHDMRVIMPLCERIHVLNHGRTIAVGTATEIRADPAVVEAYLGTRGDEVVDAER